MGLFSNPPDDEPVEDEFRVPLWYRMYHDLDWLKVEDQPGDSNEVALAKGFIRLYRDLDGVSDEMSMREIERLNELQPVLQCAIEVLRARDLL